MNKFPIEAFKRDLIIKTFVQETQFEQWLKSFFFLNNELIEKYDFVYQDTFYIKFYELFSEGLPYANKLLESLENRENEKKRLWYLNLLDGLKNIRFELTESEFEYMQYRRHNACHIFQNSYEYIQENLRIKKNRNGKNLKDINTALQNIISIHGSDRNIDIYINTKLQPKLTALHNLLTGD